MSKFNNRFSSDFDDKDEIESDGKVEIRRLEYAIPSGKRLEVVVERYPDPSVDDFNREIESINRKRVIDSNQALDNFDKYELSNGVKERIKSGYKDLDNDVKQYLGSFSGPYGKRKWKWK